MDPSSHLGQYGAIGVVLAIFLSLFLWLTKRLGDNMINQNQQLLQQQNTLLSEIRNGISAMHTDLANEIHELRAALAQQQQPPHEPSRPMYLPRRPTKPGV